jgi:hypothetical protein
MYVTEEDIKKLLYYPLDFAIQMETYQIDYVLEKFLDVRGVKDNYKENFMKTKWQKEFNPPPQ